MIFRLVTRLGLRWMIVSALGRFLIRRYGRSTIERAGRELETTARNRLPAPVSSVLPSLPPEAIQLGGSAVVAGRAARSAVVTTRRAGRLATGATVRTSAGIGAVRTFVDRGLGSVDGVRGHLVDEVDRSERELRASFLDATAGPVAATDALIDARGDRFEIDDRDTDSPSLHGPNLHGPNPYVPNLHSPDLHSTVPDPVASGRRRYRRRSLPVVNRMRRGYRRPAKPWD